jgi:hypothetical protein
MSGITGGSGTANKANVDAGHNLQVALPLTDALVGSVRMMSENDDGTLTGAAYLKSPETTPDFRLRVGIDTVLFSDQFNGLTQNTNNWSYTFVTMTASMPGAGYLQFGTVQGTAATHGAFMRSFQYFPLVNTAPLAIEFTGGQFTAALVANEQWLAGLGLPTNAVTRPTDGCWFKLTTAGLEGILAFNGTETSTGVLLAFGSIAVATMAKYVIVLGERKVEFWADDVLLGHIDIPVGNATPFMGAGLPVFMHKFCTGVVANTNVMRISRCGVSILDVDSGMSMADIAVGQGMLSAIGQNGHAQGNTALNVLNAAVPATQPIANATAGATFVGLGGYFVATAQATNVALAGDMIACSFQNPVPSINISGRNLVIYGVRISAMNTGAAVATTPTSLIWGLAWGHTAVSLATVETASFATATTHAPRRRMLGMMTVPVGAAIGALYDRDINFVSSIPIAIIRPGEFFAITLRFRIGTATASQEVTYTVDPIGIWQ